MKKKQERLEKANQLIELIANRGRRFFFDERSGRTARFEIAANGRLYFRDDYTWELLPLSHMQSCKWQIKFSGGGTLKRFVEVLAEYIRFEASHIAYVLGPWPEWYSNNGDVWGYGDEMGDLREFALSAGMYLPYIKGKKYLP